MSSVRAFRRHWKLAAASGLSLSVAMALGVISLSITNTILLLPLPGTAPDRLLEIHGRTRQLAVDSISYPDYQYFREHNHVFSDVAAALNSVGLNVDFHFEGRDVKVITRPVSDNYFAVLGVRPFLGRLLAPGDDRSNVRLAVMTWSCWKRLGADPHIVGKVLANHTIVGVAPKDFAGALFGVDGDLFTTFAEADNNLVWETRRDVRRLFLVARLKTGLASKQAQAELTALAAQLASAYPADDKDRLAVATRATLWPPDTIPFAELMSSILMSFALLVLLIACANVANLLLAIAVGRRQETAIKLALGATRSRLIREFLMEGAVLCVASAIFGSLLALGAMRWLQELTITFPVFGALHFALNLHADRTVAAGTLLLVLIATVSAGLAPALYASSPRLAQILSSELVVGGTGKRLRRNALVIAQVAICTLVLVGMGLCQRNLYNLRHVDLGFSARNLVADTVYLQAEGYDEKRGPQFSETLRQAVTALPGVESAALSWDLPLLGNSQIPVKLPGEAKSSTVSHTAVGSDYFATFGIPILSGRAFNSTDRPGGPNAAVVNRTLADLLWPGRDAVGRTFLADNPPQTFTVVGVAADSKYSDLDEAPKPFVYYALSQNYRGSVNVVARTKADPRLWVDPMARALRGLGLKILVQPITLQGWMNLSILVDRIVGGGVAALSVLALFLAIVGLFAIISYSVREQRRELGIRAALGARPSQLLTLILRQISTIAGSGAVLGLLLGIAATAIFQSQFYGIQLVEWFVLIPVGIGMMGISVLTAYLSARRWTRIDPLQAVRHT